MLFGVVVQHGDDAPLRTAGQLTEQPRSGKSRAEHEDGRRLRLSDYRDQAALAPGAIGKPVASHGEPEKDWRKHVDRPWHGECELQEGKGSGNRQGGDADRYGDAL